MRVSRRSAIIGLGALAGGAGIIGGTGAFDQVQADREVTVNFSDDSNASLSMEVGDDYAGDAEGSDAVTVQEGDNGEISIIIADVNRDARVEYDGLVKFTNNSTQTINSLAFDVVDQNENNHGELSAHGDLGDGDEGTNGNSMPLSTGDNINALGLAIDTRSREGGQDVTLPDNSEDIIIEGTVEITASV